MEKVIWRKAGGSCICITEYGCLNSNIRTVCKLELNCEEPQKHFWTYWASIEKKYLGIRCHDKNQRINWEFIVWVEWLRWILKIGRALTDLTPQMGSEVRWSKVQNNCCRSSPEGKGKPQGVKNLLAQVTRRHCYALVTVSEKMGWHMKQQRKIPRLFNGTSSLTANLLISFVTYILVRGMMDWYES